MELTVRKLIHSEKVFFRVCDGGGIGFVREEGKEPLLFFIIIIIIVLFFLLSLPPLFCILIGKYTGRGLGLSLNSSNGALGPICIISLKEEREGGWEGEREIPIPVSVDRS